MSAVQVRHEPASASVVRAKLRAELRDRELADDCVDVVLLVASELVGNAVRHCRPAQAGTLDVEWNIDRTSVTVRVVDASARLPRRRKARVDEPDGRGLAIVDALAESWGAESVPGGKQVWARIAVRRDAAHAALRA